MRILLVHNTYQQAGGEDTVAAAEMALLRNFGHEVHLHTVSNDKIQSFWTKVVTSWRTPYSLWGLKEITGVINETQPEVVHVHNFFPLLTPSIYDACRDAGVPVVQTLHNYRTICAGALLLREGKPCEDCINGSPYQAVLHGCYRNSRLGSLAVARMIDRHRRRGTWAEKVDRFIALTDFARNKFLEAGFPAERIVVKPNFIEKANLEAADGRQRSGALFVGRLSEEKGIRTLFKAWESLDFPLRIVGDGPLMNRVREQASGTIAVLGNKERKQVNEEMVHAAFLVMSSEWYEGCPMVLLEAFSQGLPVITSRLGSMAEIVEDGVTGLHFNPGDAEDLVRKVRWATEHPEEIRRMGQNALRVYEEKYTPETNYRCLMTIYEETITDKQEACNPV